ncbi:MAG: type I CRISPR-associated protein Cas7 [Planctomycetia bacterium]|nr:type I CRISPR-associated protein Cas7 [Planctomycetia bacterium]
MEGLVMDVCLKRKVRNYPRITRPNEPGFDIFVKEKAILNDQILTAYDALGINLA